MQYPVYNEKGIKVGTLETSAPMPRNLKLSFNHDEKYLYYCNTTEERLQELVDTNLAQMRKEVDKQCTKCNDMRADGTIQICGRKYGPLCVACKAEYRAMFEDNVKFREACYRRASGHSEMVQNGIIVENGCKVLWDEKLYCMGCETIVVAKYVREGSEVWCQVCCECGGDDLSIVSVEEIEQMEEGNG